MKLHNYTLRYLSIGIVIVLTVWVLIFYAFMTEEVYDNIDDGLKNTKSEIVKKAYNNPSINSIQSFGASGFRITPLAPEEYSRKNVFTTEMIYMDVDDNEEPVRMLTTTFEDKNGDNFLLEIRTSTIEADDLLGDFGIAVGALYLMLIISIFLINYFILRKVVWGSFYKLLGNLKNYTIGKEVVTEETKTPIREFTDLQLEINKMIRRIESTFEQQKAFVSNAAHESQTPLAIMSNKLELMAEKEELNEEQMLQIQSIHQTLRRLIKLNKSLLMLAKIENNQFFNYQDVNFNDIIREMIEDFEEFFEYKAVSITVKEDEQPFIVNMDKGLSITLVQNLLKNALTHNVQGGEVEVEITNHYFRIGNTSLIPTPLDENLIYNRFFRSTTNEQSTGLGLALVQTIIKVTDNLSIKYHFDNKHYFTVYHTDYDLK
ncbi:Signal transduction histidine kinase [Myroides sp. A21]|uniref:sensor histidine kinase n=1 Tax=Myroides sp. A21 TaxID=1583100 RepID=UPI00057D2E7F|nr:HAMP domain-containing sensor histidine kinase [Myroides sp. A21]AJA70694.1 Signal transduction histidine kinase [Myroides sp. A21]